MHHRTCVILCTEACPGAIGMVLVVQLHRCTACLALCFVVPTMVSLGALQALLAQDQGNRAQTNCQMWPCASSHIGVQSVSYQWA